MTISYKFAGVIDKFMLSKDGNVRLKLAGIGCYSVCYSKHDYNLFWFVSKNANEKQKVTVFSKDTVFSCDGLNKSDENSINIISFLREMALNTRPIQLIVSDLQKTSFTVEEVSTYNEE